MPAKILAFAGSLRTGSFNKKLIRIAVHAARNAGVEVTHIDLKDYPLPIFDGDLEAEGIPDNAKKLQELFLQHNALLLACPEYNSSITPVLKNTLDWVSHPTPGKTDLKCYDGKVAALLAASPGVLGGLRGLVTVRYILGNINVLVIPNQLAIPKAHEAFDKDDLLKDPKQLASVEKITHRLVEITGKLHG